MSENDWSRPAPTFTLTVSSMYAPGAGLESGSGEVNFWRAGAELSGAFELDSSSRVSVGLGTELTDFNFDGSHTLTPSGADPFDDLWRHTIDAAYFHDLTERWTWYVGGRVASAGEEGADFGSSISGGGFGGVYYHWNRHVSVGAALVVASQLEGDMRVFPVPAVRVDYPIGDRWRLRAGVPDGASIIYQATRDVSLSLGATFRWEEFRLAENGPVAEGVVKETMVPIGLAAEWRAAPGLSLRTGAGVVAHHSLNINDANDGDISDNDLDPAPFVSAGLKWRF